MADINSIALTGRLTRNLELKKTNSGKSVVSTNIAVNGFKEDDTHFIDVVFWDKTAEVLEKHCGKGSQIGVTGRLTMRKWETKDGQSRTSAEVQVSNLTLLGSKSDTPRVTQDIAPEDIDDKPISLSEIPF